MGNYKKLEVWKRAHGLTVEVYQVTRRFPAEERFGLSIQLRRAAVSIESNISEGSGGKSDQELRRYLRMARGSAREVECQLLIARDVGIIDEQVWARLEREAQGISRMLSKLIDSLEDGRNRG
jgi:four helix bundle protein